MGAKLLQDVRQDLTDVVQVCEGKKKQTNYLRTLINELVKGKWPEEQTLVLHREVLPYQGPPPSPALCFSSVNFPIKSWLLGGGAFGS